MRPNFDVHSLTAKRLTSNRQAFTGVANLLHGFSLPAASILYLDRSCLANWAAFWTACSQRDNQKQFEVFEPPSGACLLYPRSALSVNAAVCQRRRDLSGPVLRDTARLSQRYPPTARYGVFGVSTCSIGCDTPSPFSERFPLGEHAKWRCDTPPSKGVSQRYLSDTL